MRKQMNGEKVMWKIIITIILLIAISYSSYATEPGKQLKLPVVFDFGPENSRIEDNALLISESLLYDESKGYGLIESAGHSYQLDSEPILTDDLIYDGISSNQSIEFRIDLEPGDYWIEFFMHGGNFNIWRGEIQLNDSLLADSLVAYSTSFEDEDPPPYWTMMKKVSSTSPQMVLTIDSDDQLSTLSALRVFKHRPNLFCLNNGKIESSQSLQAPNASLAVRLINAGEILDAQRIIDPIPEKMYAFEKANLLMALAGRLEVDNPRPLLEWASILFSNYSGHEYWSQAQLNLRFIKLFLEGDQLYKMAGWDWARYLTYQGIFTRQDMAGFAYQKVANVEDHPLSFQSLYQLGKIAFWAWVEQHHQPMQIKAKELFSTLLPYYPDHKILKMYSGKRIPYKIIAYDNNTGIPPWAFYSTEALKNILETIHYWVDNRQADNGEFGGKYDDDVEMLRWWPIARMAIEDEKTLLGLQRLVDGIWQSDWITEGFSTKLRDVEHSSEPVADTQPMMIGLDYGNPIYVENCMQSIKGLDKLWTGINKKGHRHFKSSWYSYKVIDSRPPRDCDVPMNTRTVKAARWLAWYNRHPLAINFLREWGDSWLEDCLRIDKDKPYGIVPSAIRYEDDAIGGHADNWHHPGLFWRYYDFHGGADMLQQFLVTYDLTGNERYLEPIELALNLVSKYEGQNLNDAAAGSEEWVVKILRRSDNFAETIEKWRLLTGKTDYDELLIKYGSEYLKFYLTGDIEHIEFGSRKVLDGIIHNRELLTTEGYFTDRIEIGDLHKSLVLGAGHLESIYTGSSLFEGFYPFHSVTWKELGEDFAAIVIESTKKNLSLWVYNTGDSTKKGTLSFWRMTPGKYEIRQGPDEDYNSLPDKIEKQDIIEIFSRSAAWPVTLPSKSSQIIVLSQIEPYPETGQMEMADIAVSRSDITIKKQEDSDLAEVVVPVHNIGIVDVKNIKVEIHYSTNKEDQVTKSVTLDNIIAPLDLKPKIEEVVFELPNPGMIKDDLVIILDPENTIKEITKINNRVLINKDSLSK
jgi:hypothetical protein